MAEHRCAAGEDAAAVTDQLGRDECRRQPLGGVEQDGGDTEPPPVNPPHVGRADVPASLRPDVLAAKDPDEPVPPRHRPGDVAGEHEGDG